MRRRPGPRSSNSRVAAVAIAVASLLVVGAAPARAEQAVAVVPGNVLIRFDTATPGTIASTTAVSGLAANQTIRGIDVRPATGQLYAETVVTGSAANSVVQTYTIDPATAAATLVGQTAAALAGAADVPTGYDFNPALNSVGVLIDRMRYVNTNDENARLNPNNGALAGNDTDLTPAATTEIVAAAHDRNTSGTTGTTLYEIDRSMNMVSMQGGPSGFPSPNGGVVTDVVPLGVTLKPANDAGFDISPSGIAFAALTDNGSGLTGLYTFNLGTGSAPALVGSIGNGASEVRSLAILQPDGDGDGVRDSVDNCPAVANADQSDLDGDGAGDVCDPDEDGDGLSDAVEVAIGANPRSTNSDGDGVGDSADACPTLAGGLANGCPAVASAAAPDVDPPETAIAKAPKGKTSSRSAKFEFRSDEQGSSFACRLDKGAFKPCTSPRTYRKLKRGRHSFAVRAIDAAGNVDATPATRQWQVKAPKRGKRRSG